MKSWSMVGIVCGIAVLGVAAQAPPMRPGQWETTMQMNLPGMPSPPAMKTARCITAEELKKNAQAMLPSSAKPGQPDPCKVSDYTVKGQTVTWKVACSAPEAMTGSGEMTFKGDTFSGTMKMTHPQMGDLAMQLSGRRLGDCKN